jgi:uncharacterized protein (DUF1330 family)
MPKDYFFVDIEITDLAAYEAYRTAAPDIISAHGGRILVSGGEPQTLDGNRRAPASASRRTTATWTTGLVSPTRPL